MPAAHHGQNFAARGFDELWPNDNVVSPFAKRDAQPFAVGLDPCCHRSHSVSGGVRAMGQAESAAIARLTVISGEPSPLSIVTAASA